MENIYYKGLATPTGEVRLATSTAAVARDGANGSIDEVSLAAVLFVRQEFVVVVGAALSISTGSSLTPFLVVVTGAVLLNCVSAAVADESNVDVSTLMAASPVTEVGKLVLGPGVAIMFGDAGALDGVEGIVDDGMEGGRDWPTSVYAGALTVRKCDSAASHCFRWMKGKERLK